MLEEFEGYLKDQRNGISLGEAKPIDLEEFVKWVERKPKTSAKTHLWALWYYFEFIENDELRDLASKLRQARIKRKPFLLKDFRGVDQVHAEKLASMGIVDVVQMIEAGSTPAQRESLSEQTGVPLEAVLEFVKLSDLARISGLKNIRARLYYDAGVDTIEKLAQWDAEDLRVMLIEFVERTGFDGIAPLPKEAKNAVTTARNLPKVVEYD
jgi:hypothetical protein